MDRGAKGKIIARRWIVMALASRRKRREEGRDLGERMPPVASCPKETDREALLSGPP